MYGWDEVSWGTGDGGSQELKRHKWRQQMKGKTSRTKKKANVTTKSRIGTQRPVIKIKIIPAMGFVKIRHRMIKRQQPHKTVRLKWERIKREKEQTEYVVKINPAETTSSSAQRKPDMSLGEKCDLAKSRQN